MEPATTKKFESLFAIPLRNGLTRPKAVRGLGIRMVNMGEIFSYERIGNIEMDRVLLSEKEASSFLLEPGDLLFARQSLVWEGAGKCSLFNGGLERATFESHLIRARLNREIADSGFYFYFFKSSRGRKTIESIVEQVAAAGIRGSDLAQLEVPYLPIAQQRAIARVLGALDDKIELNRQMSRTLEELASSLFRSWFVDFDPVAAKAAGRKPAHLRPDLAALFPAHWQDSALGPIPHGWRARPVTEVVAFNPTRRLAKGKAAPYLDMQSVPTSSALPANWAIRSHGSGMKFQNGDTLMARITPCLENGKTAFVNALADDEVGWGSTEFIVMRPLAPLPLEYGYFLARSDDFRAHAIANMTGSSGRQRVAGNCFEQFLIAEPTKEVAEAFGSIVAPFMRMMKANVEESRTLAALRDTLLPKLLSGELRVKRLK